ncbi:hypothetical protein MYCTH_2118800 [Thermothelomyces thermophilus ATCC 42464]|uniref:VOC domain-containing protein n=1 Tax=Thermothelomyces thermophilus (strain ATCC 42464 / BCRC 31852 / DSM 1799) TaxID=573729 RepID=G2QE01_THET4|nr:uncharacterized protein MYCTH_2118800 [Thermothelomyces thermophilus ATCC 42464]AEO58410.1 hypothetical protein MYCTH_2118800 [Thermothelomyces thermophilus ATCC 42464]
MASRQLQKIRLVRIAHVYYTYVDLDQARQFLLDFGFTVTEDRGDTVFFKGYSTEPFVYYAIKGAENAFGGAGFVVESMADLELVSKTLPKVTAIEDLDAPGGGKRVTFYDPVDNFPFYLVYGQSAIPVTAHLPELEYNYPQSKHRDVNKTLGHFGCCVTDFAKALDFYMTRFNFKPSDLIYDDKGRDITTFLYLDQGMERVDHYTFFFFKGHQWLRDRGYNLVWGVGRHILGSQIFDYWYDCLGFILEHYVDGDLVDETTPISRSQAGSNSLYV